MLTISVNSIIKAHLIRCDQTVLGQKQVYLESSYVEDIIKFQIFEKIDENSILDHLQ